MKKEIRIEAKTENIGKVNAFIESALLTMPLDQKRINKSVLAAEEMLVQMVEHSDDGGILTVQVKTGKRGAKISMACRGREWKLEDLETLRSGLELSELEDEQVSIISCMLLKAMSEDIRLRYSHGTNHGELYVRAVKSAQHNAVLLFMLIGIVLGLALRFAVPESAADFISDNIFSLGASLFLNAISLVIVPLVFFSIAESITGFSDYKVFGRIGGKVIGLYFLTTAIAIGVAFCISRIFLPGDPSQKAAVLEIAGTAETSAGELVSIRQLILNIIPVNFASAIISGDMLQIIFIAVLVGAASGMLGEYSSHVQTFIKAGNKLFSQITNMILKFLPLATLCFMANTVLTTSTKSASELAYVFAILHIGLFVMICVYAALLAIAGISPPAFFGKFKKAMLTAFSTASSSGTMPVTMQSLDEIGVSPKIYSFSIPLGSTINMDGTSIGYIIMLMFMMRIFSIPVDGSSVLSMFLTVMMLSIGTPGIPGSSIAMTAMLFTQFGIPSGAVGYVIPLILLSDYGRTMSNVIGDAVVSAVVAKTEKLFDMKKLVGK